VLIDIQVVEEQSIEDGVKKEGEEIDKEEL
jgi:hypothetical protein